MFSSVNDWLILLRDMHSVVAFPFIVGGLILILFGWRLWKVCIAISFAIVAAAAVMYVEDARQMEPQPVIAIAAAILVGFLSFFFAKQALPLLGSLLGVAFIYKISGNLGLKGTPQIILSGSGVLMGAAMAMINRRYLVVCVTAFLGSILLLSGGAALLMSSARLYATFHGLAMDSFIVIPFVLTVPSVMSFFYQISEIRRLRAEL